MLLALNQARRTCYLKHNLGPTDWQLGKRRARGITIEKTHISSANSGCVNGSNGSRTAEHPADCGRRSRLRGRRAFGSDIRTPNIDSLADRGRIFTQFHAAPVCSVTRSMLLSGNNNHVAGVGRQNARGPVRDSLPGYEGYLSDRVELLPRLLRDTAITPTRRESGISAGQRSTVRKRQASNARSCS